MQVLISANAWRNSSNRSKKLTPHAQHIWKKNIIAKNDVFWASKTPLKD